MDDNRTLLDVEKQDIQKNNTVRFINYWRLEIKLIYGINIIEVVSILSLILLSAITDSILFYILILGPLAHLFLGCWQFFNGLIFVFLDKSNHSMRRKYLLYAIATLVIMFPCAALSEYLDNVFYNYSWLLFGLINLLILPHMVSYYYIKTLRKSIALAKS